MKIELLKALMQEFDASGIHKMKLELEDFSLEMEKDSHTVAVSSPVAPIAAPAMAPITSITMPEIPAAVSGTEVKAPIVGVFYPASSAEAEPYVKVGQTVRKGQTLCIIEAMKVMNEIEAPCDGVVAKINVEREALVEYGQVIMVIA